MRPTNSSSSNCALPAYHANASSTVPSLQYATARRTTPPALELFVDREYLFDDGLYFGQPLERRFLDTGVLGHDFSPERPITGGYLRLEALVGSLPSGHDDLDRL